MRRGAGVLAALLATLLLLLAGWAPGEAPEATAPLLHPPALSTYEAYHGDAYAYDRGLPQFVDTSRVGPSPLSYGEANSIGPAASAGSSYDLVLDVLHDFYVIPTGADGSAGSPVLVHNLGCPTAGEMADRIAGGHAFEKHASEFSGLTQSGFTRLIRNT
jgi:hypothetical protein